MEPKIEPWIQEAAAEIRQCCLQQSGYLNAELTAQIIAQHAPSSPAAPLSHMTAAEFYREVWIKENGGDPRGDWPIRMAAAYAASETARADRAEREKESWRISYETHWKALQEAKAEIQRKDAALKLIDNECMTILDAASKHSHIAWGETILRIRELVPTTSA